MGQRDTWDRTSRNEMMISTSLQKPSRISLLTLSCFIAVCATHEEPRLAYHRHKSQRFGIASAGYVLRSTCCHFEELREDKARILSPWEYMSGLCSFRKHSEKAPPVMFIDVEVWWGSQAESKFYVPGCHLYMSSPSVGQPGNLNLVIQFLRSRTQAVLKKDSLLYFS